MGMFEWKDKYATGIHQIDEQHKGLVDLINKLFSAMQSGAGKDVLDETLSALVEYTRRHFMTEELLLENYDYPGIEEHRLEHRQFTEEVANFEREYQAGNSGISIQIITFLRNWLTDHICQTDHKYVSHLKGRGVS